MIFSFIYAPRWDCGRSIWAFLFPKKSHTSKGSEDLCSAIPPSAALIFCPVLSSLKSLQFRGTAAVPLKMALLHSSLQINKQINIAYREKREKERETGTETERKKKEGNGKT